MQGCSWSTRAVRHLLLPVIAVSLSGCLSEEESPYLDTETAELEYDQEVTGSVGDVMRESVHTATSWVRARLEDMGLAADSLETLGDAEQVAALVAMPGRRLVPSLQPCRFEDPIRLGKSIREDLIEDGVFDPVRGGPRTHTRSPAVSTWRR